VLDAELHTFASVDDVLHSLMALLPAPAEAPAFTTQLLELEGLERARHSAGDPQAMAIAVQEAGADAKLTSQLVDAFLGADTLARITRSGHMSRTVTILASRGEVWTFTSEGDSTVRVDRPCADALRQQLDSLWPT
jgi:hypothetical protein